ncbi:MAG TPA: hypothetical protein VMU39_24505 [Solirubrobacteraceae bacterium]|nr:hypothetical protein [Solirubrobacteraceae bacterium]
MSDEAPNSESKPEGAWREWTAIGVGLTALLSIMALIISVVALSSSSKTTTTIERVAATPASGAAAAPAPLAVKMVAKTDDEHAKKGSDGKWHDAILGGDFTAKAGQTITVTVSNFDNAPHSYTSPALGLNVTIPAGGPTKPHTVTFTFKAPTQPGSYEWFCALPCDPWAMAHDGYMRGHVTITA